MKSILWNIRLRHDITFLHRLTHGSHLFEFFPLTYSWSMNAIVPLLGAKPYSWALVPNKFSLSKFKILWKTGFEMGNKSQDRLVRFPQAIISHLRPSYWSRSRFKSENNSRSDLSKCFLFMCDSFILLFNNFLYYQIPFINIHYEIEKKVIVGKGRLFGRFRCFLEMLFIIQSNQGVIKKIVEAHRLD